MICKSVCSLGGRLRSMFGALDARKGRFSDGFQVCRPSHQLHMPIRSCSRSNLEAGAVMDVVKTAPGGIATTVPRALRLEFC